jgi:hypothetical protein
MTILLSVMMLLTLAHFIYESIVAPSLRLKIRYDLFALRDELRFLKIKRGSSLDDKHYVYLQDSINTMISHLARYDIATF